MKKKPKKKSNNPAGRPPKTPGKPRVKTIFSLDPDVIAGLKKHAENRSQVVNDLIAGWVKRQEK